MNDEAKLSGASDGQAGVGLAQIDAVLAFLPVFEAPGCSFGEWQAPPGQLPYYNYSADVLRFVSELFRRGLARPFDWRAWQAEAAAYVDDPALLAAADLTTLGKLLTLHVRRDRFVEGHLAGMLERGHITAILRRLAQLRAALA